MALLLAVLLGQSFATTAPAPAQAADCQFFSETGFQVCGRFLEYWQTHGGLRQQGFPISQVFDETNAPPPAGDGKVHRVQYFQRARFEEHTENAAPYDVLLGLLGTEQFKTKYPSVVLQSFGTGNCQSFPDNFFTVCGRFLDYWKANGGLEQQGYPISGIINEQNAPPPAGDGKVHRVQYFQRARFEEHLEFAQPNDVLLGLLGTEQYKNNAHNPFSIPNPVFKAIVGGAVGYYAMATVITTPGAACSIRYIAPNGNESNASNDGNLKDKTAETNGEVSWSWLIATNTPLGTGSIIVTCNGATAKGTIAITGSASSQPNPTPTQPPASTNYPAIYCLPAITSPQTRVYSCADPPNPIQSTSATVWATLIINGVAVYNVGLRTTWHYKTIDQTCNVAPDPRYNLVGCTRIIGEATPGYTVIIDVAMDYNGQTYYGQTSFTTSSE